MPMHPDILRPDMAEALREAGLAALAWYHVPAADRQPPTHCYCGEPLDPSERERGRCEPCVMAETLTPEEMGEARGTR